MKTSQRELLRKALFEATFVVMGLVLALAANAWREARAEQRKADTARTEIVAEMQANQEAVQTALDYHLALADSLQRYSRQQAAPGMRVFSKGFVAPAQVHAIAWETASQTGTLALMDYDEVLRFSRVYAGQEAYAAQARSVGQIIYQKLYEEGPDAIAANYRNLLGIIYTFIYRETQLLQTYAALLNTERSTTATVGDAP